MAYVIATAPAIEPMTTAEAKTHVRVDISADDSYIDTLVKAAREFVEQYTRRALITQTWDLWLDEFPDGDELLLGYAPLQSVTHVKYVDSDGATATMTATDYVVDPYNEPGKVVLKGSANWPTTTLRAVNGVNVRFVAGYGTASTSIPQPILHAMKLLVGHWYENREQVIITGAVPKEIPFAVQSLLTPYRVLRWV